LSSIDLAKFGVLYQQKGKWNNKQIVSESWIKKSTTSIIQREENNGGYGYQLWCDTLGNNNYAYKVSYATGNEGNMIVIFEDIPIVIVITATAFGDPLGHSQANEIIEDYLLPLIVETIHEWFKRSENHSTHKVHMSIPPIQSARHIHLS